MEARVVPRAEHVRTPEVGEVLGQRPRRRDEVLVVAARLALNQSRSLLASSSRRNSSASGGKPAEGGRYGTTTGAIVTGLWIV